jgi:hypothetical protein
MNAVRPRELRRKLNGEIRRLRLRLAKLDQSKQDSVPQLSESDRNAIGQILRDELTPSRRQNSTAKSRI